MQTLTPKIIHSAGQDAGNRSMRAAGRTAWNADDYSAATRESNRLYSVYAPMKPAPFSQHTDVWFDRLAEFGKNNGIVKTALLHFTSLFPSCRNLRALREELTKIDDDKLREDILATVDAILTLKFQQEFRFTYHTYPKNAGQSSACGELFSLLRQALEYHD